MRHFLSGLQRWNKERSGLNQISPSDPIDYVLSIVRASQPQVVSTGVHTSLTRPSFHPTRSTPLRLEIFCSIQKPRQINFQSNCATVAADGDRCYQRVERPRGASLRSARPEYRKNDRLQRSNKLRHHVPVSSSHAQRPRAPRVHVSL